MKLFNNSKKGVIFDVWGVIVFLCVFITFLSLVSVIAYFVNVEIQALPGDVADDVTKQRVENIVGIFAFIDRLIPFIFVLLWAVTLVSSFKVSPTHPLFFVLSFVALLVLSVVSVFLTDFFSVFFAESIFNVVIDGLSNSLFFASKFHLISFFILIFSLVIFYNRNKLSKDVGVI